MALRVDQPLTWRGPGEIALNEIRIYYNGGVPNHRGRPPVAMYRRLVDLMLPYNRQYDS